MVRATLSALILLSLIVPFPSAGEDMLVYVAHQDWPSRIYLLSTDGSVIRYFEYDFTRLCDIEVVGNELYVVDAFAPRAFRVDLTNGDLDVIIDDWSLYYFYDLGFDGTYFYVDEWDLNRYDINGNFEGRASFDRTVFGSAWDGSYMWMLNDEEEIECWDLSGWPDVIEIPESGFLPPTPECRGLWFDGSHFWSAESRDGLGKIYRFNYDGRIVQEWTQPAFQGWAAGLIVDPLSGVNSHASLGAPELHFDSVSPNPLCATATIRFHIPREEDVTLRLFDTLGRSLRTIVSGRLPSGAHEVVWEAENLRRGIYLCRLQAGNAVVTEKIVLAP